MQVKTKTLNYLNEGKLCQLNLEGFINMRWDSKTYVLYNLMHNL